MLGVPVPVLFGFLEEKLPKNESLGLFDIFYGDLTTGKVTDTGEVDDLY